MIRVACDCRMAEWSGVGRYSTSLVRALAASGEVDLVQVLAPGVRPPVPDARMVTARGASPFTPAGAFALAAALRKLEVDVVHCLHFPTPLPAPRALVVTLHDLTPLRFRAAMPSHLRRLVYGYWNARATRVAERLVVPSAATAADVAATFPSAAGKIRVTPEAADDFAGGPVGEVPAVAEGRRYVLGMGNTKAHKDLPTLLRAFAELAPAYPDLRLVLAGPDVPGYASSVLGTDPAVARVAFSGAIDDPALRALYAGAAAFAFPSRYEGFGLPVLEAMALGTPVVVADAAASLEVADDAALTFPAGDDTTLAARLALLLDDDAERARLIERGRARAASHSWAETARRTIEVYREVVA